VCYQLKILTTAVFSVVLLKKSISVKRWISLVFLTIGVSLAQLDASNGRHTDDKVTPQPSSPDDWMVSSLSVVFRY
jgi:drug/metabolite transporter (DMT)-like permease